MYNHQQTFSSFPDHVSDSSGDEDKHYESPMNHSSSLLTNNTIYNSPLSPISPLSSSSNQLKDRSILFSKSVIEQQNSSRKLIEEHALKVKEMKSKLKQVLRGLTAESNRYEKELKEWREKYNKLELKNREIEEKLNKLQLENTL